MLGPHDLEEFYEIKEEAGQGTTAKLPRLKLAMPFRALAPRKRDAAHHADEVRAA